MNDELRTASSFGRRDLASSALPGNGLVVINIEAMVQRVQAIQDVRERLMKPSIHYYTLGDREVKDAQGNKTKVPQWSLGKPGAELLTLTFGLSPELDSRIVNDDPNVKRVIQVGEWVSDPAARNGVRKEWRDRTMTGFYEVVSTCTIYSANGTPLARASGTCNNLEASFINTPYSDAKNPVMKRAEKRALVAAVLIATGSSDMFTQDLEDMDQDHPQGDAGAAGGKGSGATKAAEEKPSHLSEGQRKLIFAVGKKMGASEDAIKFVVEQVGQNPEYAERKKVLDLLSNNDKGTEGRAGAEAVFKKAQQRLDDAEKAEKAEKAGPAVAPAADGAGTADAGAAPAGDAAAGGEGAKS